LVSQFCRVFYIEAAEFSSGSIPLTVNISAQANPAVYHQVYLNFYDDIPYLDRRAYLTAVQNTSFRVMTEGIRLKLKKNIDDVDATVDKAMRSLAILDAISSVLTTTATDFQKYTLISLLGNAGETAAELVLGFMDSQAAAVGGAILDIGSNLMTLASTSNPYLVYPQIIISFAQAGVQLEGVWALGGVADKVTAQYMAEGLIRRSISDGTLFLDKSDYELKYIAETYILPSLVASGDCSWFNDTFLGCGFDNNYDQAYFLKSFKSMRSLLVQATDKFANGNFYVDVDRDGILNTQDTDANDAAIPGSLQIQAENNQPIAVISASATSVNIDTQVTLNGLLSSDNDGDSLTYSWSLEKPLGSFSALSSKNNGAPTFTPDKVGIYTVGLRVNDGHVNSLQKNVVVNAIESYPNAEVVYEDNGAHIYISNLTLGTCQLKQIGTFTVPAGEKWTEIKFSASMSDLILLADDDALPALDGIYYNCTNGFGQGFYSDRTYDYFPATNMFTWSTVLAPGAKLRLAAFSYKGLSNGSVNTKVTVSTDLDGDGVPDENEPVACRNNPAETTDSDGDLVCDNTDAFPNNPMYSQVVPVDLAVSIIGGGGTITSSTGELNCPGACTLSVNRGATITLIATPAPGMAFAGWSGGGCNGLSPICNATLLDATSIAVSFNQSLSAPSAPTIGLATSSDRQATVVFSAPANDGGSMITNYTVISNPDGMIGSCNAPCSSIVIPGLTNGITYTFTVRAINSLGASGNSTPSNSVIPVSQSSLPDAPTIVSAMAGGGNATVSFTPPTSDGGNAIFMYSAVSNPGGFKGACLAPCSSIEVSGLTSGTAYIFTINAINGVGTGPSSLPSSPVTPFDTTPNAFTFTNQTNAELGTVVTSNTITVSGIDAVSPIAIDGGSYAINGGAYTSGSGSVTNGQSITVRVTSSGSHATPVNATVTIGGVSGTFSVTTKAAPSAQSISFGLAPTLSVGGTGTVTATGGASGNAVTFTSTTQTVCTTSGTNGSTVTALAAGNCTIVADQAGNANYTAAPQATQIIAVSAGAQSVSFGPVPAISVGGSGTVSATGGASGNAVTFTSTTPTICTTGGTNGSTVTALAAGNCTIAANQAGNANYTAAPQATQTITVSAGAQSVSFGPVPAISVGGSGTVSATGGASGNPVTFTSTTQEICTTGGTNGSTVTALAAGNCIIAANQAGNANYTAAPHATQIIAVSAGAQSVSFGPVPAISVGGSGTVSATGGASGNAVTFTSTTPTVCTTGGTNGSTVTALAAGNCTIAANQAGNANYTAAPQATQTIAVVSANVKRDPYCGKGQWIERPASGGEGQCESYGVNTQYKLLEEVNSQTNCGGYFKTYGIYDGTEKVAIYVSNGNCRAAQQDFPYAPPEALGAHCAKYGGTGNYKWMYSPDVQPFGGYGTLGVVCEMPVVAPPVVPVCAPTATPASISAGTSTTLAANCSQNPTSYGWTSNPSSNVLPSGAGGTVTPTVTTTYTVTATNADGSSAPQTVTVTVGNNSAAQQVLAYGWNLLGNSSSLPIQVATVFGDAAKVNTVWKWDAAQFGWQFYTPSMDATALQDYATSKNYGVLSVINPGEGYWVNALQDTTLASQSDNAFVLTASALRSGWNLVATGKDVTPKAFNLSLSDTPPTAGEIPLNVTTLWAWDNPLSKWYFYSPSLDGNGGTALLDYTVGKGYLDFAATGKLLGAGLGFWVNKP